MVAYMKLKLSYIDGKVRLTKKHIDHLSMGVILRPIISIFLEGGVVGFIGNNANLRCFGQAYGVAIYYLKMKVMMNKTNFS